MRGLRPNLGDVKSDDSCNDDGRRYGWCEVGLARPLGGLSTAALTVSFVISFTTIIYSGSLAPLLETGLGLSLLGAAQCAGWRILLQFPRHDLPSAGRDRHRPRRFGEHHGGRLTRRPGGQPDGHHCHADRRHHRLFRPGGLELRRFAPWLFGPLYPYR